MTLYSMPLTPSEVGIKNPTPIVALDVKSADDAIALVRRVPSATFVKVGFQLFTAAGPDVVRRLRDMGKRVFLDLKLHDIPNTVARAVDSASDLGVDLLTLHASGGAEMLMAAREAADRRGHDAPKLLAVTILTSLSNKSVGEAWGRSEVSIADEVVRLAQLAADKDIDGVVASAHEVPGIRAIDHPGFLILTPGIRLAGDGAGDQKRVATPFEASRLGADYIVIGRSVTAAERPEAAFDTVLSELRQGMSQRVRPQ